MSALTETRRPSGVPSAPLPARSGAAPAAWREPLHVCATSSVERIHLDDGSTIVVKTAASPVEDEARVLRHARINGVPVPRVLASSRLPDGRWVMLLEDLGPAVDIAQDIPLGVRARAAAAVHGCLPLRGLSRLDTARLALLPETALGQVSRLRRAGRWTDTGDISIALRRVGAVADMRAAGAELPPYGMCHGAFHRTSLHAGSRGLRILGWASAFTGPGLLDLASWEDPLLPLNTDAIAELIGQYVAAGGAEAAVADRGGLPAAVWAGGWHRVWICERYLRRCLRRGPDSANDHATQQAVRRHLEEAVACLA